MPLVNDPVHLQLDSPPPGDVTRLLHAARDGDRGALDRVISLVYDDLRVLATRQLQREFVPRTMHPTSLVHEVYMKLARSASMQAGDRAHFFAVAARAMRQVLVDDARRRGAMKRRGEQVATTLGDQAWTRGLSTDDLLALNDAIDALEPRQRHVVECRFFGGMDEQEIATALGITERTVRRDWVKARAWLYLALYDAPAE
jgi:RNA polymerase sigma factor (TIGR02999 family)